MFKWERTWTNACRQLLLERERISVIKGSILHQEQLPSDFFCCHSIAKRQANKRCSRRERRWNCGHRSKALFIRAKTFGFSDWLRMKDKVRCTHFPCDFLDLRQTIWCRGIESSRERKESREYWLLVAKATSKHSFMQPGDAKCWRKNSM